MFEDDNDKRRMFDPMPNDIKYKIVGVHEFQGAPGIHTYDPTDHELAEATHNAYFTFSGTVWIHTTRIKEQHENIRGYVGESPNNLIEVDFINKVRL